MFQNVGSDGARSTGVGSPSETKKKPEVNLPSPIPRPISAPTPLSRCQNLS